MLRLAVRDEVPEGISTEAEGSVGAGRKARGLLAGRYWANCGPGPALPVSAARRDPVGSSAGTRGDSLNDPLLWVEGRQRVQAQPVHHLEGSGEVRGSWGGAQEAPVAFRQLLEIHEGTRHLSSAEG